MEDMIHSITITLNAKGGGALQSYVTVGLVFLCIISSAELQLTSCSISCLPCFSGPSNSL